MITIYYTKYDEMYYNLQYKKFFQNKWIKKKKFKKNIIIKKNIDILLKKFISYCIIVAILNTKYYV